MPFKDSVVRRQYHRNYLRNWMKTNRERVFSQVHSHRRRRKLLFVSLLGGSCSQCGYNKNLAALDIHHKNGRLKRNGKSDTANPCFHTDEWIRNHFSEFELLCANCHTERHKGKDVQKLIQKCEIEIAEARLKPIEPMQSSGKYSVREYKREYYLKHKLIYYHKMTIKRLKRKLELVRLLGGKCSRCGYDRCLAALEFHHKIGRGQKDVRHHQFYLLTKTFENALSQLGNLELVCANCHRELHRGSAYELKKQLEVQVSQ